MPLHYLHATAMHELANIGAGFAAIIKASIPPDAQWRAAVNRYLRDEITVEELEELVDKIVRSYHT